MRIRFCGVRGSTPAPGAEFTRVGGNTSCIALWHDGEHVPRLVLDAGTGIRAVSGLLDGRAFDGTILLSHLHWDHVQGLPFFAAADRDDARVRLRLPRGGPAAEESLARAMSPPHFPIGPDGLRGDWTFGDLDAGWHRIEGLSVLAVEVPHKGGRTFGYRIEDGRSSLAYVPDHLTGTAPMSDAVRSLVEHVDVLVHDAQFTTAERAVANAYGHATVDDAVVLGTKAGVGCVVLFHHSPSRTDAECYDLLLSATTGAACDVKLAVEQEELRI